MSDTRKYALLLGLLFAVFIAVEYYTPKPIIWEQTFTNKDKIPFGTFVIYELLPDIFPEQRIASVRLPITNQLENSNGFQAENYLFVNNSFAADTLDLLALERFAMEGNSVFIAAENFDRSIEKKFGFTTAITDFDKADTLKLRFLSPGIKGKRSFKFPVKHASLYLKPDSTTVGLITLAKNSEGEAVLLKKPIGNGAVYFSSTPLLFCNYYTILTEPNRFAAIALSHLPVAPVLWDEYQKQGRTGEQSVFRVLMSHEPLSWAYYIALAGIVLFVIFESKRTQRVIPVWEKPRNTTLDFVKVVGNLYFNHRNHKVIAEKKINYFFEFLRLHYFEQTNSPDPEFATRIAARSGLEPAKAEALVRLIENIRNSETIEEAELIRLNNYLEEFYRQAGK